MFQTRVQDGSLIFFSFFFFYHDGINLGQTPEKSFNSPPPICPHKDACQLNKITSVNTQRRVTFHLPDGSQESCSDSGLGDPEPSSTASTNQPLPLNFPQDEYYEQTSPNSRTEGDGNSDPESTIEVNLQKALAEASETCTQECLILGHSDSCWMPPALAQFQGSGSNSPTTTPTTAAISATLPSFGFQQSFARGAKANMISMGVMDGRHTLGRSVPKKDDLDKGMMRPQFYNTLDRHCSSKKEDPVKVIPLASFSSPGQQMQTGGGSDSFLHEHQL
ncbi:protocadherin-9-like [Notolabrus celidotus]|uniref:protocadherin-9-like n=1 Tax=Notolabrus celidotus TaxID=1203425 RepID=UPI00148F6D58|nr:protocadherin-9-like [Notolabrus celidotus]